jgi:hypothetical protein
MRIRMKTRIAGPGVNASPGDIIEPDRITAHALIEGGYAEQIDGEEPETATIAAPEKAVLHRGPKPKGR